MATEHSGPAPADDLDKAFAKAMAGPPRGGVDRDAAPVDVSGFTMVCGCGKGWAHQDRCARCAAPKGNLICGLANNHRGQHQAIALWL